MSVKSKIYLSLLVLPLLAAWGCSNPQNEQDAIEDSDLFTVPEPVTPIDLNGSIKIIDGQESAMLFSGAGLTTANQPAYIDAQTVGDAEFVMGQTPDQEGFLSKVVGKRMVDGKLVADLEPATIDEVVKNGDWKFELPAATQAEIDATPFANEELTPDYSLEPESLNLMAEKTTSPVFKLKLGGKSLIAPSTRVGNFSVSIDEGELTYAPSVTIGGQHKGAKITQFSFVSNGTLKLRMKITASLSKGASKPLTKTLFPGIKKPFAFMIGAIPVAGTVNLDIGGGLSMNSSVNGTLKTGISCTFPIKVGGRFQNGKWSKVSSPAVTCTADKVTTGASASAGVKLSVQPELSVRLYGVVGPAVDIEPYLAANTTFKPSPKSCTYEVKSGVSSSLSVSAKLFKWTAIPYSTSLFDRSMLLKSGSFCQ